jgi:dTDP-3-amino-3,4,6-trideoxy-alpha-D-glucose transaminase
MRIPFVNLRPAIEAARAAWEARLAEMFARSHFILGDQVAAFERELAAAMGARRAAGVGTGTAAIELALREAGVTGEVVVPALTAPFTGVAVLAAGAKLRFADVDDDTLLLTPATAAAQATRQTAAILPVHLYGGVCDLAGLQRLARGRGIALIQDACQAHGATCQGRPLADFSPHVAYSFYPTKNLGALGDGGAVLTNRPRIDARLRMLRDGGRRDGEQVARMAGINSRLDEMQACFLRAFLERLGEWNAARERLAAIYDAALADCPGARLVEPSPGSVRHLYVIRVRRRDRLRDYLTRHGIGTAVHYPVPLHRMPAFGGAAGRGGLPVAERACREVVSLPLWVGMTKAQATEVAGRVREFLG